MKKYMVDTNDVIDFLRRKSYNCTGRISTDLKSFGEIKDYPFDNSTIFVEWQDYCGNKTYLETRISEFEFIAVQEETYYGGKNKYESDFSMQWQNFQLERHQQEYIPHLTNWAAKKIGDLIKEREQKKANLDLEKQRIDNTYALDINYYKNYILKLKNQKSQTKER